MLDSCEFDTAMDVTITSVAFPEVIDISNDDSTVSVPISSMTFAQSSTDRSRERERSKRTTEIGLKIR